MDYTDLSPRSVSGKTNSRLEPGEQLGGRSLCSVWDALCLAWASRSLWLRQSYTESPCFFRDSLLRGRAFNPKANQHVEQVYVHHPDIYAVNTLGYCIEGSSR